MAKGKNRFSFILIIISLIILSSCNSSVMYSGSQVIPDKTWKLLDTPVFNIPVTDTGSSNNIFFTIRTGASYPYRNIYLFVTTSSPDGLSRTDTLQYNLADEEGRWYGRGFGDVHELNLPYKSNVFFPIKGIYQFKVQHGMRIEDLKGVYDFGLRIEKISK
jgi:gliding motility-associated lipoprotein GldH